MIEDEQNESNDPHLADRGGDCAMSGARDGVIPDIIRNNPNVSYEDLAKMSKEHTSEPMTMNS